MKRIKVIWTLSFFLFFWLVVVSFLALVYVCFRSRFSFFLLFLVSRHNHGRRTVWFSMTTRVHQSIDIEFHSEANKTQQKSNHFWVRKRKKCCVVDWDEAKMTTIYLKVTRLWSEWRRISNSIKVKKKKDCDATRYTFNTTAIERREEERKEQQKKVEK